MQNVVNHASGGSHQKGRHRRRSLELLRAEPVSLVRLDRDAREAALASITARFPDVLEPGQVQRVVPPCNGDGESQEDVGLVGSSQSSRSRSPPGVEGLRRVCRRPLATQAHRLPGNRSSDDSDQEQQSQRRLPGSIPRRTPNNLVFSQSSVLVPPVPAPPKWKAELSERVDRLGAELELPFWQRIVTDPRLDTGDELLGFLRQDMGWTRISLINLEVARQKATAWLRRNRPQMSERDRSTILVDCVDNLLRTQPSDCMLWKRYNQGIDKWWGLWGRSQVKSPNTTDLAKKVERLNDLRGGIRWTVGPAPYWARFLGMPVFMGLAVSFWLLALVPGLRGGVATQVLLFLAAGCFLGAAYWLYYCGVPRKEVVVPPS
jgi:hypothetical protein